MEMKKYIEMGEEKAGSQKNLAEFLETRYTTLVLVKSGKKSLTTALCIKLARYINEDELKVIAASNLIIEKDETRRKIFESCFSKVANFTIAAFILSVFSMMTPSPANASQQSFSANSSAEVFVLCKIEYILSYESRKFHKILSKFKLPSTFLPIYSHFVEYPYIR